MSQQNSPAKSPYKGLQPYGERDRDFFFGRETDREVIISNLFAAPLTIFYGASGVGKSSVLLAAVVPELRESKRVAVIVFREWQDAGFEVALKREVLKSIDFGDQAPPDLTLELDEFLFVCAKQFRGSLFFILDQFEEYFLYNPVSPQTDQFDAAFARTINRTDINANFLLSMRDDGLGRLDRFQKRIPNLLNNMLRLEHLNRRSAEMAIRKPLTIYNQQLENGQPRASIEDALVEVLLEDLQTGKVTLDLTGQGRVGTTVREDPTLRIETPFLQVVLTRLWDEEYNVAAEKNVDLQLRLDTYRALGRATTVVRTHLDKIMETERLLPHRDTAAALFHFLVTPGGMKVAHTVGDLASYAERPEDEIRQALNELSAPDVRILRPIAPPPGQPNMVRYEIFHDVLAPAILDWRLRYQKILDQQELEQQRARAEKEARSARLFRRVSYALGAVCLVALVAIGIAAMYYLKSTQLKAEGERLRQEGAILKAQGDKDRKIAREEQLRADQAARAAAIAQEYAEIAQEDADKAQKAAEAAQEKVNRAERLLDERARQIELAKRELVRAQAEVQNEQLYRDAFRMSRDYNQREEALSKFNVVLNHYRNSRNTQSLMPALFDAGRLHVESGQFQEAKNLLDEALAEADGPAAQAATWGKIGDLYRDSWSGSTEAIRASEDAYQRAYALYEGLGDPTGQAMMLLAKAQGRGNRAVYTSTNRDTAVENALKEFAAVAEFARTRNLPALEGLVWMTAAETLSRSYNKDLSHRADLYEKARSAYASASDVKGEINALKSMIEIYRLLGNSALVAKRRTELLEVCRKGKDLICEARTLIDIMDQRSQPADSTEVVQLAMQARQLFLEALDRQTNTPSDLQVIGSGLYSVALTYGRSGNKSGALDTAEKAATAYRLSKIHNYRLFNIFDYVVSLSHDTGNTTKARDYLKEAIEESKYLNQDRDKINALVQIGLRHADLKDNDTAHVYLDAALKDAREFDDTRLAGDGQTEINTVSDIGRYLIYLKQEDRVGAYFERVLSKQRSPKIQLEALKLVADIYYRNFWVSEGLLDKALAYYERALTVAHNVGPYEEGRVLLLIADVYRRRAKEGDVAKADQAVQRANELMKSGPAPSPSPSPTP